MSKDTVVKAVSKADKATGAFNSARTALVEANDLLKIARQESVDSIAEYKQYIEEQEQRIAFVDAEITQNEVVIDNLATLTSVRL